MVDVTMTMDEYNALVALTLGASADMNLEGMSDMSADVPAPSKRTRKKTKTDKLMSKALEEANKRLRKKNGQLRSGKTQADVMRLAHRIRRKMAS